MAAVASSMATQTAAPSTHLFTCNTCQVAFRGGDLQRAHMQSDWHRYNLKRRVASLPPLTSEIFAEKVLANQASAAATAAKAAFEKVCPACERTYFSQNAFQNHLGSQKHKMRVAQLQAASLTTDDDTESMMSSTISLGDSVDTLQGPEVDESAELEFSKVVDGIKQTNLEDGDPVDGRPTRPHHSAEGEVKEPHPLSPTTTTSSTIPESATTDSRIPDATLTCLFCNLRSQSVEANVVHMQAKHGMFIPEKTYLVDLEGLVGWLSDRVQALHECLYCGLVKHTAHGIQTHMRDKGHCMIAFDSEEEMIEIGQFYDFRASYSDDEEDEDDDEEDEPAQSGGVKLGARRAEQTEVNGEDDGDDWEDEDVDDEGVDDDDADASTADSARTTRPRREVAYQDDYELHLPSGRTAGHRSLARYFRQNLHSYPTAMERAQRLLTQGDDEDEAARRGRDRDTQVVSRANGGLGLASAPEEKRRAAKKMELKEIRKAQRHQKQYEWGINKRGNNQQHFRDPLLQ